MDTERVPGIDVSRWQGTIDWRKVAQAGYRFAFVRASIGDTYTDPSFFVNWKGAQNAGILVSAYHVVTPDVAPKAQIGHFFEILDDREPDLPLALDVERNDRLGRVSVTTSIRGCIEEVQRRSGEAPMIYTARWFWDKYLSASSEWARYDLWVASYTSEPVMPRDWRGWRFWQYTEKGSVAGVTSRSVDLNWFAGDYAALLRYAKRQPVLPEIPTVKPRARVVIKKLNVRTGPGKSYEEIGDLYAGDVVEMIGLTGRDVWVEFEPGKWVAMALNDEQYMVLEPRAGADDAEAS